MRLRPAAVALCLLAAPPTGGAEKASGPPTGAATAALSPKIVSALNGRIAELRSGTPEAPPDSSRPDLGAPAAADEAAADFIIGLAIADPSACQAAHLGLARQGGAESLAAARGLNDLRELAERDPALRQAVERRLAWLDRRLGQDQALISVRSALEAFFSGAREAVGGPESPGVLAQALEPGAAGKLARQLAKAQQGRRPAPFSEVPSPGGPSGPIRSALLVFAHPDDETMMGGALGRLREAGVKVYALYLTAGEGGVNLEWEDEIRVAASQTGVALDRSRPVWSLPADHPLMLAHPEPDLGAVRASELAEAARRYGLAEYRVLDAPDEWSNALWRGVTANWDFRRLAAEVSAFARRAKPDIVFTLLPDNPRIHVHHQAVGQLARRLFDEGRLGGARWLYAVEERDWYPAGAFDDAPGRIVFRRDQPTAQTPGTYADFQRQGASAHKSQTPGRAGVLPFDEVFVPLRPGRQAGESPLASVLAPASAQ